MKSQQGFTLIEVMLGMVIASFALTVLFSFLNHLMRTTQKSATQATQILQIANAYPMLLIGEKEEKPQKESSEEKPQIEKAGSETIKDYAQFLKKITQNKQTIHLVFAPPPPEKEKK